MPIPGSKTRKPLKRRTRMTRGEPKRPSLSRRSAKKLREAGEKKQKAQLKKVGKKGRENAKALAVFKKECARLGIDRCEVRGPHCTGTEDLTWAHGRKRRELEEGELETFAIVACMNCHRPLDEELSHEEMANEVSRIIALRPERYLEAA